MTCFNQTGSEIFPLAPALHALAIAHPHICVDSATCAPRQQGHFFPFYQLLIIGYRVRYQRADIRPNWTEQGLALSPVCQIFIVLPIFGYLLVLQKSLYNTVLHYSYCSQIVINVTLKRLD